MIDPRNLGVVTGGLVADPELAGNGKIVNLRVAVDYAGNDRVNPDNKSGYFNVVYFLNDDNQNAKFVGRQISEGKLKKGSQVQVVYRLQQERWEHEGRKNSGVRLVAEALTYAGSGSGGGARTDNAQQAPAAEPAAMPSHF